MMVCNNITDTTGMSTGAGFNPSRAPRVGCRLLYYLISIYYYHIYIFIPSCFLYHALFFCVTLARSYALFIVNFDAGDRFTIGEFIEKAFILRYNGFLCQSNIYIKKKNKTALKRKIERRIYRGVLHVWYKIKKGAPRSRCKH